MEQGCCCLSSKLVGMFSSKGAAEGSPRCEPRVSIPSSPPSYCLSPFWGCGVCPAPELQFINKLLTQGAIVGCVLQKASSLIRDILNLCFYLSPHLRYCGKRRLRRGIHGELTVSTHTVNVTSGSAPQAQLEGDERWQAALRVAASPSFSKSARLRDFLLYVCEKALSGHAGEIREQLVGAEVFNRKPDYNPGEDNIVRVEARELRKRLDRYFTGDGAREPFRIRIPKGSYVPVFEPSTAKTGLMARSQAPLEAVIEGNAALPMGFPARASSWWSRQGVRLSWTAVGVMSIVFILAMTQTRRFVHFAGGFSKTQIFPSPGQLWTTLFKNQRPVTVVAADSSLVLVQDITRRVVPLTYYANRTYAGLLKGPSVAMITGRPYTSLADTIVTSELMQTAGAQRRNLAVRYARDLEMRDLENSNLIFLGSAYSDPWISEFDSQRNFVVGVDEATRRLYFLNKSPRPGEPDRYYAAGATDRTDETYGLITYLPNLRRTGNVLILEGTSSAGTEAAGDFITGPKAVSLLRLDLRLPQKDAAMPYFQLLIKTTSMENTPNKLQVIASRVLPASP